MATKQEKLTKSELMQSLAALPEDATVEDFAEHLAFILGIEQGLADLEAGQAISHEELLERINDWAARRDEESIKQDVIKSLARLPDDASAEDIEYRVYVVLKVGKALAESEVGRKVSHQEARQRMQRWLK